MTTVQGRHVAVTATREHGFDAGHRVVGHGGRCAQVHGHGFVVEFSVEADQLDALGMVLDFGVVKARLCAWVDAHWDHRFLCWSEDKALAEALEAAAPGSVVLLPCNPTAENLALHLIQEVAPRELAGTGARCTRVVLHETRKCRAEASL